LIGIGKVPICVRVELPGGVTIGNAKTRGVIESRGGSRGQKQSGGDESAKADDTIKTGRVCVGYVHGVIEVNGFDS
jgi:hypothetical protein